MSKCLSCGSVMKQTPGKRCRVYCSDACRMRHARAAKKERSDLPEGDSLFKSEQEPQGAMQAGLSAPYDASSIQVLPHADAVERFPWLKAGELAARYHQPVEFVERMLRACHASSWPEEQAIRRYLEGDRSVPVPPEMQAAHREGVLNASRGFGMQP